MSKLFDKLLKLYRLVTPDQNRKADVRASTPETLALLKELLGANTDSDDTGLTVVDGDPDQLKQGDTLRIRIHAPRTGLGGLFQDIAALVRARQITEPERYYLWNPARAKDDPDPPDEIVRYREVLALIALLKESATYLDDAADKLVFVQAGRFDLPVHYTLGDITPVVVASSAKLRALFGDELHREQKLAMLAAAVRTAVAAVETPKRFVALLARLDEVAHGVADSYRLFCANFSYEKVRSDTQDAQIEFTAKIHKTFSDIQNQLLAIPIATVVVATQMKRAIGHDAQFWVNSGVLLGGLLFVVLFCLLVMNQWRTLSVLANEIERRRQLLATQYRSINPMFRSTFNRLRRRVCAQRITIAVALIVVLVGFAAACVIYAHMCIPGADNVSQKTSLHL